MALTIARSCISSVMESMSKLPCSICLEMLLNMNGPISSATGPLPKGVSDAWEKCSWPFWSKASKIACFSMSAVQEVFLRSRGSSGVHVHI